MERSEFASFTAALQRAESCFQAGDFRVAFEGYQELLKERLRATRESCGTLETSAELVLVERLAHLATLFGNYDAGDALLDAAAVLNRNAGNGYGSDYCTLQRTMLSLAGGRLRDAEARLVEMAPSIGYIRDIQITESGLCVWEKTCHWDHIDSAGRAVLFSRLYLAFGTLLMALGQYRQARICLERGKSFTGENNPELARQARLQLDMTYAEALLEEGSTADAERHLAGLGTRVDAKIHPGMRAEWLEYSGKLALLRGQFGVALERFEELVTLARSGHFDRAHAVAMLNLAQLRIVVNQTAAAVALIHSAQQVAAGIRDTAIQVQAAFLLNVALARSWSQAQTVEIAPGVTQMWQGVSNTELSMDIAAAADPPDLPQTAGFLEFFEDRSLSFQWYLGQGELDQAASILEVMNDVFKDTDSMLIRTRLNVLAGTLSYYAGKLADADSRLTEASVSLRTAGLRHDLWQTLQVLAWTRTRAGRSSHEIEAPRREADDLVAKMAGSLVEAERAIFLLNKWTADEERLAAEIDALVRLREEYHKARWYRRPALAWRLRRGIGKLLWRIDRYKALLASRALKGAPKAHADRVPTELQLLRHLSWRQATIAFLVLPDRTLIISATGWRLEFGLTAVTRVRLRDLVRQWHVLMSDALAGEPTVDTPRELESASTLVGQLLQLPALLQKLPSHVTRIKFVPDDVLHGMPFAAIRVDGCYLVERYALSIAFEARTTRLRKVGARQALLAAASQGGNGYDPLPGAGLEIDEIHQLLKHQGWQVTELRDEEASPHALLAQLPSMALLHVACHGVFEPNFPDRSGLILMGRETLGERLTLSQLSEIDLSGLQQVTLSACWSADNFVLPGRWVLSLPETLYRAGTHTVLGWLWPAPDRYTTSLMASFYRLLARHERDRALQLACLECLQENRKKQLPPTLAELPFWAGIQLYGVSNRLSN